MTILALVAMLTLSISTVYSKNDNFSVDYVFEPYMINGQWMIKDTMILNVPGEPLIPYKAATILLPAGADIKDIKVKHGKTIVQKGFDLPWGQPPCTFSDEPVKVGKNEKTYGSNNPYPSKLFDIVGIEYFRGYAILNIHLYPVQYMPKSGTVKFYERLTVEVQFGKKMKNKLYRGLAADKADAAALVDNPEVLATYEDGPAPLATEEYIIITNDTMASTFQDLADWKANFVNGASVYTVSWITSNYSGVDNQEKIRNFIIDKYTNNGTLYVLLGGDVAAVPYRGFYVSAGGYTDSDMAADMYFGCLDGNFDADGDHIYGEPNDSVDWLEEVFVGRAPVETVAEAEIFVNKVIVYASAEKPKVCQFHAAIIASGNNPDSRTIPWNCEQWVPSDYVIKELFEQNGPITKDDWRDAWDGTYNGEPHVPPLTFQHAGHGSTTCYGISSGVNWCNADVATLTNDFWPIHMSVACHSGNFKYNDCLAETYVKDDCGAIACMLNVNYGWYSTNDASKYSGDFLETMFRGLFDDGKEHLGELLNQAKSYWVSAAESDPIYRWCYYEINLLGDPETPCLTKRSVTPDSVTITNPSNGSTVSGTVNITVSYTGDIDEVRFYIDGSHKSTDTTAPFSWNWDTTAYSEGSHTIRVDGYVSGTFADDDTVTVTVDNVPDYYVTITNPTNGSTVSGTVTCTADSNCTSVKWYINGVFKAEDTTAPFQYSWDTTQEAEDQQSTVTAEGIVSGVVEATDSVTVTVDNEGECLGTALLLLLVLFGAAGILRRR